jgi:DNA-binding MarR family transcriptional regulator
MTPPDTSGRFAFDGLDRSLHEKARLGILTSLLSHRDGLAFTELKGLCKLTDGNLSRHLSTLEEAGLVEQIKSTKGRRPLTTVRLTPAGRRRFLEYLELLEGIVTTALSAAEATPEAGVGLNPA